MAERRMFTKKITDDDHFMSLSASAQALYLHLSMSADDDGFCNQVSIAMFKSHASVQDLEALLEKRYIYQFENGVIVIKHWRMANALRKDRYTPTTFKNELAMLDLDENGAYTWLPDGCQMVADCLPQDRLGKDSIDKDSIGEVSIDEVIEESGQTSDTRPKKRFVKPSVEELEEFIRDNNFNVDPETFFDYYEANGWMAGKNHMKDWKATVRNWDRRESKNKPRSSGNSVNDWLNA